MAFIDVVVTENYKIQYDLDARIGAVIYMGRLTSEVTSAVYAWLGETAKNNPNPGAPPPHGWIFDFRQVTDYDADNFATARSKSISYRLENSDSANTIPTALLVDTIEQEVMVQISMQLAKQGKNPRVRILKSDAEALKFFDQWHMDHAAPAAPVAKAKTPRSRVAKKKG